MSEDSQKNSSGVNDSASGENQNQEQSKDGLYPKDFVEKLKKEKANARAEAEKLKQELQARESSELEKAGKLNELVELERKRAKELEEKNNSLTNTIVQKAVLNAVKSEAEKMGAQYFEVVEKMIDPSKIEVNPETLDVDLNNIRNQIVGIKSKMPLLFKTEAPKTNDLSPSNNSNKISNKSLTEMNNEELKELLRKKL